MGGQKGYYTVALIMPLDKKVKLGFWVFILFYPIVGLWRLCSRVRNSLYTRANFEDAWAMYIYMSLVWIFAVIFAVHIIAALFCNFHQTIVPLLIIGGMLFIMFGFPSILLNLLNKHD